MRKDAIEAGFPRLAQAGKTTVWRIFNKQNVKPQGIRYYLEKRNTKLDRKMQEVLIVYRAVSLYAGWRGAGDNTSIADLYREC